MQFMVFSLAYLYPLSPSNYQLWTFNASLTSIKYQKCDFIFANVRIQYNIFDCIHIHLVKSVCMYHQNHHHHHHHHHHHCICFKCLFSLLAWVEQFLIKIFQSFLSLAVSLLTFSFRSFLTTSFHVFLDCPLGKLVTKLEGSTFTRPSTLLL